MCSKGKNRQVLRDESVFFREMEITHNLFNIVEIFCSVFCLINWFSLCAFGLVFLVFTNNNKIISFHFREIGLDEFRGPFFHKVRIIQDFFGLSFVHSFSEIWDKTHALSFFHEVEFHLVDVLKFFKDPFLWLLSFKGFYCIQYVANDSFNIFESLVSQVDMNFELRVAIVGIWSTRG